MENKIVLFEDGEIKIDVEVINKDVWLTGSQIAKLFNKDINTINDHIKNIFDSGELDRNTFTGFSGKSSGGRKT